MASAIVDAAVKVHSLLGPGLLESVYQKCLAFELRSRGLQVECEVSCPIHYGDMVIDGGLRMDMVVEGLAIVELKAIDKVLPVHEAQLITYLKLSGRRLGFLLNFNVSLMRDRISRRVL